MAKGEAKQNKEAKRQEEVLTLVKEDATGVQLRRDFEVLAADCLNGQKEAFSLRFLANASSVSEILAQADKYQSSMVCPWSSYSSGGLVLEQETPSNNGGMLALNAIAFGAFQENNMMVMTFRAKALPLGEVSIPRCSLKGKTRSGPKSVDLDPSNFVNALRKVPFKHLLQNCEEDTSQFNVQVQEPRFKLGELRQQMEDQNIEYKYPEETWDFGKFVQKSFNKYLFPLVNGASEKDVELWLGVDKDGRNIGGSATLDGIMTALSDATLECFPPIPKKEITIDIYPLDVPSVHEFVVEWVSTASRAQRRILELEGRGWQVKGKDLFGVVVEKQNERADTQAVDATEDVLKNTCFERYVCCVRTKSVFREAYINRHTDIGSLRPFDVWLRARKNVAESFLNGLRSSSSVGFQLGGQPSVVEGILHCSETDGLSELRAKLTKNPKKHRYVVFTMDRLDELVGLIRTDAEEQAQSVYFDKCFSTWKVAPMLGFRADEEALARVKLKLQAFPNVTVVEILCIGYSQRALKSGVGKFLRRDSFEVVGCKLPQHEIENYKEDSEQFLFPDGPHNDISWATVEYYVVATTAVRDIVELVEGATQNQERKKIIHVLSEMMYSGLTSTLKKAAVLCAERAGQEYSVLFLRCASAEPSLAELGSYLMTQKTAGRKCVIFQDADLPSEKYDDALRHLLNTHDFCCLVKGSCNTQGDTKPDVHVSCVWDVDDIRAFRDVFAKSSEPVITEKLDAAVRDAEQNGFYPFFVLPLIVRQGAYIPIMTRMKNQVAVFAEAGLSNMAECLAFLSATCDEPRIIKYLTFSRVMDGINEVIQNSLLKPLDNRGTVSFVHPEAGRVYLWVLLKDRLPSKELDRFPLDEISNLFKRVLEFIMNQAKYIQTGLVKEICFERGVGSFSPFSSFLLRNPEILDRIYTEAFVETLARVVPPCDVLILYSRLNKHLKRFDLALQYVEKAVSLVHEPRHPDYRKVKSTFASVTYARYTALKLDQDYERCRECLEELIRIEQDSEKKEGFEKRLTNLRMTNVS